MPARFLFLGLLIGGVALGWYAVAGRPVVPAISPVAPAEPNRKAQAAPPTSSHAALGSSGCSAQGCHGAVTNESASKSPWGTEPADLRRWRESSVIYHGHDPHRRSYDVLGNKLSKSIAKNLAGGVEEKIIPAHEDTRCLACHSNPTMAAQKSPAAASIHAEGVSCEACHGNSADWIGPHTQWNASTDRAKALASTGMTALNDVTVRAKTCLGCHVGSPENPATGEPLRDVNHDLIAAGHPRLNFDFATYLERLPAHWIEKDRTQSPAVAKNSSLTPWYWTIGRVAANRASYELLAARAALAENHPLAWPELAEHDCFSCHRNLGKERRDLSATRDKITGRLGREEPSLASLTSEPSELRSKLEATMNSGGPPAKLVATDAAAVAGEFDKLLEGLQAKGPTGDEIRTYSSRIASARDPLTWAEVSQRFYALDLFNRTAKRGEDGELEALRMAVRFERGWEKDPKNNSGPLIPTQTNSPEKIDMKKAASLLQSIAKKLAQPAPANGAGGK